MITQEMVAYIRAELAKGTLFETIKTNLKSQGWTDLDISEAQRIIGPVPGTAPIEAATATPSSTMASPSTLAAFTTMPSAPGTDPAAASSKHKKHKLKILITIVVIAVLLAAASYAYAFGYVSAIPGISSHFLSAATNAKTVSYDATVTADLSKLADAQSTGDDLFPGMDAKQITLKMKGSTDQTNAADPKIQTSISLDAGITKAAIDIRYLNKVLYAEMTQAPDLGFFSLDEFTNKWYSFPYDAANPMSAFDITAPASSAGKPLTDEQKAHIKQLADNAHLITITQHYAPETINGTFSQHLGFTIDKTGAAQYIASVINYLQSQYKDNEQLSSVSVADITKSFDSISNFKGDIWVGLFTGLPSKITASFGISDTPGSASQVGISAVLLFSDWNKPAAITAPATSTSIKDLFGGAFSANDTTTSNVPAVVTPVVPVAPVASQTLAQCLTQKGVKFYGAFWCPHCQAQKKTFGSSAKDLPYIECSTPDGKSQTAQCTDAGISGYPTWEFADGSRITGEQTLQSLATKSMCLTTAIK